MFDHLLRIADEIRAGLQERFTSGIKQAFIQGALLEVDSYWYRCAVLRASGYWGALPLLYLTDDIDPLRWAHFMATFEDITLDWSYRPPRWKDHCKSMGYLMEDAEEPEPIVIRVLLREHKEAERVRASRQTAGETKETEVGAELNQWELPRRYHGYPIVYEIRPSAVATSGLTKFIEYILPWPGRNTAAKAASVGRSDPNTSGTAGGRLINPRTGQTYVVSCAHVMGLHGTRVFSPGGGSGRYLGDVRFSSISPLNVANTVCDVELAPHAGRLDVAVAELRDGDSLSTESLDLVKSISALQRFQAVTFTGRVSGKVEARMNALSIWNELQTPQFGDGPAGWRCFGGIFELMSRRGDRSQIADRGDSGAWVVDEFGGVKGWVGVLIGKQGTRAYGSFAQHILNAVTADQAFPDGLVLPPH